MADKTWVGTDMDYHEPTNWSPPGVPIATDNVIFDGSGYTICWPTSDIEAYNFSILSTSSVTIILEANGVIHNDFLIEAGYFGVMGGPDHILEFKGNYLNTGGSFSIGTGVGRDPECIFSGIGKTYELNQLSAATFQHLTVTGDYVFTGTRLGVANVSQTLSVPGVLDIQANGLTICDIDVSGNNATIEVTGQIKGTGRLWYRYKNDSVMGDEGVISIRYMRFDLQDALAEIEPRTYTYPCEVEIDYDVDGQVCRLKEGNHYFHKLTLLCDNSAVNSAEFDCKTYNAKMWLNNTFNVYKDDFPNCILTIRYGLGPHVIRGSIDMYFSYASSSTHLVVDASETTLIFYPKGRQLIVLP